MWWVVHWIWFCSKSGLNVCIVIVHSGLVIFLIFSGRFVHLLVCVCLLFDQLWDVLLDTEPLKYSTVALFVLKRGEGRLVAKGWNMKAKLWLFF